MCTLAFRLTMHLQAQDIPVIEDFATLEARMNQPTDTLIVYNFWATWCRPCVAELPYFEKLNQEYAEKKVFKAQSFTYEELKIWVDELLK